MENTDIIAVADCDSFFVSCEQNEQPELWGKPVCVMGNNDRCIVARSAEAKQIGVRMGMPYFMAIKEFPNVVYLSGHMDLYLKKSKEVMETLREYIPEIEQYSIDEAFLNLKGLQKLYKKDYYEIGQFLRKEIKEKTGLPVSLGISTSKTLAKIASYKAKKSQDRVCLFSALSHSELEKTNLEDVWGIGRRLAPKLNQYGITNALELVETSDEWLIRKLGKKGLELKGELLGKYIYKINTNFTLPKSIQKTSTFPEFTSDKNYIKNALHHHIHTACRKLRITDFPGISQQCSTVEILLKTKDFLYFTEKMNLKFPTNWELDIIEAADKMFEKIYNPGIIYRSSGIVLSNLINDSKSQLSLFGERDENAHKKISLGKCIDNLEAKFGKNIVKTGFYNNVKDI